MKTALAAHKPTRKAATLAEHVDPALVDQIEGGVRAAKSLALGKLTREKLSARARAELERRLVERGLERTPKVMRVPIEAQIVALVRGGARVLRTHVTKLVKGGSKGEVQEVIERLVRAGRARLVIRTKEEVLVGTDDRVLDPTELARLSKIAAQLAATLRKVAAKGLPRTLLLEDVAALFEEIELAPASVAARRPADAAPPEPAAKALAQPTGAVARQLIDDALRRLEDSSLRLVPIAKLVRELSGQLSMTEVHRALDEAAEVGAIELRPDGGTEFTSAEDARLCPPGPRDTRLSYARRLAP